MICLLPAARSEKSGCHLLILVTVPWPAFSQLLQLTIDEKPKHRLMILSKLD